jgi:glycosyltransferase involved in cell wall biosynthesis
MCGGMNFPPAFAHLDGVLARRSITLARHASELINHFVPGKLEADVLLVANRGTEEALPRGVQGRVIRLFESGVDLEIWKPAPANERPSDRSDVRFAFAGRFVDWKGVQFLVPALAKAIARHPRCSLDLVGGGELEPEIRATIAREGLAGVVRMHGWLSRPDAAQILRSADVFVMPSLRECGGTAILEAMAMGKPVITTNWGGPADYVDASCGLLVDPTSPEAFIDGMADAMVRLAGSEDLRRQLGEGGVRRVRRDHLAWDAKADRMLELLHEVTATYRHDGARRP